ncbi:anti-sigma factor RsbA family regulatory protein [Saccharomonospora piscinae]|uniref:anti-sigma factor RsbA family regulatory protein n=1 Tax=Saccharomonospora piscinae TaxID=687388 RepID=UPI000464A247|nr:anti-sigma factor RsbA family regulatory protein [Saccharomonospora piscinae]
MSPHDTTMPGGHHHTAAVHHSDEEFLAIVAPFLRDGVTGGEVTLAALRPRRAALLRRALPVTTPVTFLDQADAYATPAATVRHYRDLLTQHVKDGADRVRLVGELDDPGHSTIWSPWARYEAAINELFDDLPLWSLCLYDGRVVPAAVLDDVRRTHPWLVAPGGGQVRSPGFTDPRTFLAEHEPDLTAEGVPSGPATVTLHDPRPDRARAAAQRCASEADLDLPRAEGLVLAVSETVSNALHHGLAPLRVRLWAEPGRVVVTVTDGGAGPADPFTGLVPARRDRTEGGLGLWITHQVCDRVLTRRHDEGYTVALVVGTA